MDTVWWKPIEEEVARLQQLLTKANMEMVEKVEQVMKLSKKVAKLKDGKGSKGEAYSNENLGNNPANDFENPAQIFPEEVWEAIFNEISDWKGLFNLRHTCSLFPRLLRKRNPTILFPQIFPSLYKHLEGGDILLCRTVCSAWKYGVDRFFEEHKSLRPHDDADCDPRQPPFLTPMEEKKLRIPSRVAIDNVNRYRIDTAVRQETHGILPDHNPFIGRAVEINDRWSPETTKTTLELYGKHIWYLTVNDCYYKSVWEDIVLENLAPKLRKLRLNIHLSKRLDSSQCPFLNNLETLHIDSASSEICYVLSKRYHLQLKRVHMVFREWVSVYKLGWPSLVELHLKLSPYSVSIVHNSLLKAAMPNLRKLGCECVWDFPSRNYYMLDGILNIISKLSQTTRLNTIRFVNTNSSMTLNSDSIKQFTAFVPPSIQTLEMEHCESNDDMTDYSFLLHFPFLENINLYGKSGLNVTHSNVSAETNGIPDSELVQVSRYIYKKELYKSNIWVMLPRLKVLTFQSDLYTREGYDNFKKRNEGKRT